VPANIEFGEYWLLETAVTGRVPFNFIDCPPRALIAQWNKQPHGLSKEQLIATLHRLFQAGDISAWVDECRILDGKPEERFLRDNYTPSLEEIERAFRWDEPENHQYVPRYAYSLTAQGGQRWEEIARPDWSRFHELDYIGEDAPTGLIVTAGSLARAEEVLQSDFPRYQLRRIAGIDRLHELRPWHATYWKTLPDGYRLQWACERDPNEPAYDIEAARRFASDPELQRAAQERWEAYDRWHREFPGMHRTV
jgi:hypothetical protein